jgi:O-antigen ligase
MIGDLDTHADVNSRGVQRPAARADGAAWSIAALVLGAVIAVDPAGLVPTGPLRWTVVTVTTGCALVALVRRPVAIPKSITALWAALIGVLAIATFDAVDPLSAWIGTPDRRLGLLAWITFPALFLCGNACSSRAATRRIAHAATLGALVVGAWSVAELVGRPPLGLEFADARAGGPFGQPAYLGAACLLLGPLAAATAVDRGETRRWRQVGALGLAGALLALAASQTRAAWIGAIVAIVAVAIQQRGLLRRHRTKVVAVAIGVAALAITIGVSRGANASRLDEWRIATRTIADHPLVGVGPEGYRVIFPQEVSAAYVREYGSAVYPDRAHNGVLDVTIVGGVAAGALYIGLLLCALVHAGRALRRRDPLDVALGAAVIAYVAQQQFLFPLAELDPILWVLVGMLVARTAAPIRVTTLRARWLGVPLAIATLAALWYGGREVLADRALKRAATTADVRRALHDADHATELRSDSIRSWYVAARVAQRGDALTDVDAALDRVERGLDRSSRDPALRDLYGQLLVERAARSQLAADIALARRELDRLVAGAPHDPELRKAQVSAHSLIEIGKP